MNDDWTELYRPENLNEVLGNPKAVKELRDWANAWESGQPMEKAVVLIGPPGIGKTSTALALAKEYGWGVVEMNASDQRNAEAIKRIAVRGAMGETFTDKGEFLSSKEGRRKLIILDEADNIFGREDFGGVPAMADLIKNTKQPVILIVNDFYNLSRRSSVLKSETRQVKFSKLQASTVRIILKGVAADQNVQIDEKALNIIAEKSNGDMRAALRDLQAVSLGGRKVVEEDLLGLGDRLSKKSMYDLMGDILHGTNPRKAKITMAESQEDVDYIMKWVDENIPYEYKNPEDLERAYRMLSRAATFMGRVQRRQYFGFWGYANDLMSYGVTLAKAKPYKAYVQYRFPMMLLRLSRSKEIRGVKADVAGKLGQECHASMKQVVDDILPYFEQIYQRNKDFRLHMSQRLQLGQEEIAYVLDQKVDSSAVKHLMQEIEMVQDRRKGGEDLDDVKRALPEKKRAPKKPIEPEEAPAPKRVRTIESVAKPKEEVKGEKKPDEAKGKQKSLFEY